VRVEARADVAGARGRLCTGLSLRKDMREDGRSDRWDPPARLPREGGHKCFQADAGERRNRPMDRRRCFWAEVRIWPRAVLFFLFLFYFLFSSL
jgi:hypothetical protein